jgi:hypothetical protein
LKRLRQRHHSVVVVPVTFLELFQK